MSEEEFQFAVILLGAGILAAAVIIDDVFSVHRLWTRFLRSRKRPTPQALVKAHTKHHQFYHHTHHRFFETTYISFYLFVLSFLGSLAIGGTIIIQNLLRGSLGTTDDRLVRLSSVLIFFLISRWYYRQEHHYIVGHKLIAILSCVILVDFVHVITNRGYLEVAMIFTIFWAWVMGILVAITRFQVSYRRDVVFSMGIPVAVLYYMVRTDGWVLIFILLPPFVFAVLEFLRGSELDFQRMKRFLPNPLPFRPVKSTSFCGDLVLGYSPAGVFRACSVIELLFWALMTPIVLIPVSQYLQSREEQVQQWRKDIVTWSRNEYVLEPEIVADRLGLKLEDTFPLLNELKEEGELSVYESPKGLVYGLQPSAEMDAFTEKFDLVRTELPERDRDLLEYILGKRRVRVPKSVLLSVMSRGDKVEVSLEPAGGTLSAVVPSVTTCSVNELQQKAYDINSVMKSALGTLAYLRTYTVDNPPVLDILKQKGESLFESVLSESSYRVPDISHLVLETDLVDVPFELMWDQTFFALQYGIGRRLRVHGPLVLNLPQEVEKNRALVIADPDSTLGEAVRECDYLAESLSRLIDTVDYIKQEEATTETVRARLHSGYTIIHYAGHVTEHGLDLSDGVLKGNVILRHLAGAPLVFVNGCRSAGVLATSLAGAFLQGGALGYLGSLWDVHDVAAARLAVDFYTNCLHHHTLGEALRKAKEHAFATHNIAWSCFVLFGDPTLQLI
ncbi:MAG: CHAT domain-containing protein [Theionarchaea archaeon]|nr:CHAT domain-containing protein [Theionarchaea archaeon]